MIKIIKNELEEHLKYKKIYHQDLIESYNKEPNNYFKTVELKLLKAEYIEDCKKIIKENPPKELTRGWMEMECYFCHLYKIYIWNNDNDYETIEWKEKIYDVTIEKLIKILENSDKKYLIFRIITYSCFPHKTIVELEKE